MSTEDENSTSPGSLDNIIEQLGEWRKYHIINYILIFFVFFLTGLNTAVFVFVASEIDFRCEVPECESLPASTWSNFSFPPKDKCNRYAVKSNRSSNICTFDWFENTTVACDRFIYGSDGDSSIVKDFNLGCQEWKRTLVGSAYTAGFFISISLSGIFSDRYGRKPALALSAFLTGSVAILRSFSNSYLMFIILQFLETAIGGGLSTSIFIWLMEIVSPKNRLLVQCLQNIIYSFGTAVLPGISWIIGNWRTTLRVVYTPSIFVVTYIWILDESARWLLVKNRHEDAIRIIRKAERMNGVTVPEILIGELYQIHKTSNDGMQSIEVEKSVDLNCPQSEEILTLKRVRCSPTFVGRVLSCVFMWITCTFTFHGLSINSVRLTDNRHLSYVIISLTQIPANVVAYFVMDRFGRRKTLIVSFLICGVGIIFSAFIPKDIFWVAIIPDIVGKFTISLAFTTIYMYTTEIFPTSVRQSLFGTCSTLGRIGAVLAPQVQLIAYYVEPLPPILFGLLSLASGILVFTIPETARIKLPDTMEEAKNISRSNISNTTISESQEMSAASQ